MASDLSKDTFASRNASIINDPSSSCGRNSVPRRGTSVRDAVKSPAATTSVSFGRAIVARSNGAYRPSIHDAMRSAKRDSGAPPRKIHEAMAGTNASASSRLPKSAMPTVIAIGRNIRPSRPCRVKIGT